MSAPDHRSLGEILRDARVDIDRSLRDVAKQLDISASYLSDIENDRRIPAEAVLRDLAKAMRLDFETLMSLAGRLDIQSQRLLKRSPAAAILFRKLSNLDRPDDATTKLLKEFEKMNQPQPKKTK